MFSKVRAVFGALYLPLPASLCSLGVWVDTVAEMVTLSLLVALMGTSVEQMALPSHAHRLSSIASRRPKEHHQCTAAANNDERSRCRQVASLL